MRNWEVKKLGEICTIQLGKTPYRKNPKFWDKEKLSGNVWLSIADLKHGEYVSDSAEQVSELGAREIVKIPKGTMLLSFKLTLGRVSFAGTDLYTNEAIAALLNLDKKISKDFLFYYFSLFDWDKAAEGDVKVKGKTLNKQKLKELQIPLPPLPEQQRIVSILDEAFAVIERSRNAAIKNLKNAKELFESYLQGVFGSTGSPTAKKGDALSLSKRDGWEEKTLKELTTKIGSGATPRGGQESYKAEGISLVRSMNVHDWEFRDTNLAFIDDKQAKELDGVTLQEDDVLLNITGASVARCCVFPKEYLPARVNQHVSIIRPKKELLNAKFLNLLLTSKPYKDQLLFTGEQGATRQAITKAQIEAFKITIPPLQEQQTIVRQLDALRAETQKLEAVYQKKIADLEELKKSILQKAFAGELKTEKAVEV